MPTNRPVSAGLDLRSLPTFKRIKLPRLVYLGGFLQKGTSVPQLIEHIDAIARRAGRTVLYVQFHEDIRERLD
jgi:hypothetical protein